CARGGLW
nr:immunoglobulin heavy chain junction region [Mus musculus]